VPGYTRRQLKQDKVADTAQEAVHWASGHRQGVIWVLAIILVVAVAAGGFYFWNARQNEQANVELGKAMQTFTASLRPAGTPASDTMPTFTSIAERGKAAQKQFKDVADKYSLTHAGKIAAYLAGAASVQAGDTAAAEQQLKAAAGFRDQNIASLAKMALGAVYQSTNRPGDAAKIYQELADHPTLTVSKAEAQLQLAELYQSTDPKQAITIYQQVQKDNPNTPAAQIAAGKLAGAR
jgi:predicted negative regulator of RcsB-dependent stress response